MRSGKPAPRSWLFVPADSNRKMLKAIASEADAVIFDLEDSVAAAQKEIARELLGLLARTARRRTRTLDPDQPDRHRRP